MLGIGLFLILEVAGLVGLAVFELSRVDWRGIWPKIPDLSADSTLAVLFLAPPAALTLLAALSFVFFRRRGWLLAAISQGLTLAVCLWLYAGIAPFYIYPIMVYCTLMVLYLNTQDVRMAFYVRRRPDGSDEVNST